MEEIRTLSAKDSVRVVTVWDSGCLVAFSCEELAAGVAGVAKGFACAEDEPDEAENGFAFPDTLPVRDPAPNKFAPRSCFGASGFFSSSFFSVSSVLGFAACSTLIFLVARRALMLPCLRLQVFLQHPNIYSRRSSSGKWSGRSPWSSRRRCMGRLQTLQFAKSPGGGVDSSSHVWLWSVRIERGDF